MFKLKCPCCPQQFDELEHSLYRHITDCTKIQLSSCHRELSSLREEYIRLQIQYQNSLQKMQKIYDDSILKMKETYENTVDIIHKNSKIEYSREELNSTKTIMEYKYKNEIYSINKKNENTITQMTNDHKNTIFKLSEKYNIEKQKYENKIKELAHTIHMMTDELTRVTEYNKNIQQDKKHIETEYIQYKQNVTDEITNKDKYIQELLTSKKKQIEELNRHHILYDQKILEIKTMKEHYDKDKEYFQNEITNKMNMYKTKLKEEYINQTRVFSDFEKEFNLLKSENEKLRENQTEINELQEKYQSTYERLQQYIKKYDDLEKTINSSLKRNRQAKIKKL